MLSEGVSTAGVLTADVGMTADVEVGDTVSPAVVDGVSEGVSGNVLLTALEGRASTSVSLSLIGVVGGLCSGSSILLLDEEVGVGVGVGMVEVGSVEGVVEDGMTIVVGMLVDGAVDGVIDGVVDGSVLSRSDSKVSLKGKGTGGRRRLVADCVPFVTIWRLTCFKRYFGLLAPPCPAGKAAAAGLNVASTARDAAKTIDDLRTIAVDG